VELCYLARNDGMPIAEDLQRIGKCSGDPARRFIEDQRSRDRTGLLKTSAAIAFLRRKKSAEEY
jgi:hypothetical protein